MNAIVNGNRFVKTPHLFVPGKGTYYPSKEAALKAAYSPNGVGLWCETYTYLDQTWFQFGYTNIWD
jgi:hypothetical protein